MCLIVLSLCWCCIVCSSSSIFSFLCYVLWTIVLLSFLFVDVVLSVPLPQSLVFYVMFCGPLSYCTFSCWCCIVCSSSSIFSFLCYVLWTIVLLSFLFVDVVLSVPLPQSLVFYVMFCGPCVLLSFLFVDVVLSVPLPQSLVFYVMFCGPCVLLSFLFVDVVLSVPLPQSLVFYVMFCGPLSYCPFSLLMLYCLFLFLNL